MRPDSYKVQNGCYNCAKVFRMSEYDEPNVYFCHIDGSERPKCGSVAMEEDAEDIPYEGDNITKEWCGRNREFKSKQWDLWDAWAAPREVASWGICDNWELEKSE